MEIRETVEERRMAPPEGVRVWLCLGFPQSHTMTCPGLTLKGGSACPEVVTWRPNWSVNGSRDAPHLGHIGKWQ